MIGRVDLVTSEPKKINESLNKLKKLDPKLLIYPGHGDKPTILRHELETNPYLLM
jgi:glyoxylase-like metal-dependent hydrolase (beta-lactamase superfamily II)